MKLNLLKLIFLICFLVPISLVSAQDQSCEELLEYRNKVIVNLYNKNYNKYKIRTELISDIKKIKSELIKDIGLRTSNIVIIPMVTKLLSNAIEDCINISSPQGSVVNLMKKSGMKLKKINQYEKIDDILNFANNSYSVAEGDIEAVFFGIVLEELGRTGAIVTGIQNLYDNIKNFNEFSILKRDVTDQLNSIEKSLIEYNKSLELSSYKFNSIRDYLGSIDLYLKNNCKKEVARDPIDIESKLWDSKEKNSSIENKISYSHTDILALLDDPEFLKNYNFDDTKFVDEIMNLYKKIDYSSEASLTKFNNDLNNLLNKYLKNTTTGYDSNNTKNRSNPNLPVVNASNPSKVNTSTTHRQQKQRVISTYSDFKSKIAPKNSTKNTTPTTTTKSKSTGCKHDAAWHKRNGSCAIEQ